MHPTKAHDFVRMALAGGDATDFNGAMIVETRPIRRRTVALLTLLGAFPVACQRATPAPAPATPAPPPPGPLLHLHRRPNPDTPGPTASAGEAATATRWMAALRQKGTGAITTLARAPFDFRDTRTTLPRGCGSHVATDPRGVAVVAACIAKDKDLHATLLANPEPRLFATSKETLPEWAKPWAGALAPGVRPMSTFIHGDKAAFDMILLVTDDGVHGVWQNVTYEPK